MALKYRAFLFSDIVGSTAHWEADSPVMLDALATHDRLVRGAVDDANGTVFAHTGDGVAASFPKASDAIVGAAAIISRLAEQDWPNGRRIEVRVGLHAGEAHQIGDNWFGPIVSRAARVSDAALPGQILATTAVVNTTEAVSGLDRIPHGHFTLKGIDEDIELVELAGPGGSVGPPRVRSRRRTNATPLQDQIVGRGSDLAVIGSAFAAGSRLVTITGIGGMGKTTLARAYVSEHLANSDEDVWWVDLAAVADGADLRALIESSVREVSGPGAASRLSAGLLILDNCEHLTTAVGELVVEQGLGVRVLATCRRPIGSAGEHVVALRPLETSDDGPATALFLEVLHRIDHTRRVTADEREAIGRLCEIVAGVPLAIEMIAARCRSLPIESAEELLKGSLRALTDRTGSPSQASIEEVIRWSFDRLGPVEARVFASLSLLRGFDFATVCRLWADQLDDFDVVDALDVLVRENLLLFDGRRYQMLEPIRLFAGAELDAWQDRDEWESRLVAAVLALFHGFERELCRFHPLASASAMGPNLDSANARRALEVCLARNDIEMAIQVLKAAGICLFESGEFNLLRSFARQLLERTRESASSDDRAALLFAVGQPSWRMGEPTIALDALRESAQLYRVSKDRFGSALATTFLAATHWDLGDLEAASAAMNQALHYWNGVDDALFGHSGAPIFYWYLDRDPALCRQLIARTVEASGEDEIDPHVREIRALLTMNDDPDSARDDLVLAADQWAEANNSGCLAHTLEAGALWAVRSDQIDLAHTLRSALQDHRQRSGIPPLALEMITSSIVDAELAAEGIASSPGDHDGIGIPGAHQLFANAARAPI